MSKLVYDPRRGIYTLGKSKPKRSLPKISIEQQKRNEPQVDNAILSDLLLAIQDLGDKVTNALQDPGRQVVVHQISTSHIDSARPEIIADESIIDVGIGNQPILEKGSGSASLNKLSSETDKELAASKSKLRGLKKGK